MERHTTKAAAMTFALFLIAPPLAFGLLASSGANSDAAKLLGFALYFASAWIFWSWLRADESFNPVPRHASLVAVVAYVVVFVFAVVGYLFYSRGFVRGFGASMWFALLVAGAVASVFVEVSALNAVLRVFD